MKKENKKIRPAVKAKQKLNLKLVLLFSATGISILIMVSTIFYFSNADKAKAASIDVRNVHDQILTNEWSLPAPQLNHQPVAGPNTVFIQQVKPLTESSPINHE